MAISPQVKSRERVTAHGEVFTAEREVNAMLDLVKQETERIESRFLEPACGTGNFLEPILRRKLAVVKAQYHKKQTDYEKYAVLAITSLYGVDLLEDNVKECRERLFTVWRNTYVADRKCDPAKDIARSVCYVLEKNILCGDALTMLQNDGSPIIFAQWDFVMGAKIKRKDYRLDELMKGQGEQQLSIEIRTDNGWEKDPETGGWIPAALKEYSLMDYWHLQEVE